MIETTKFELKRLEALCATNLLDTAAEERFDRITRIAGQLFDVPMALISLIDEHRQWFKSSYGMDATETKREDAFCSVTVRLDEQLVVEDALLDPRFSGNPFVVGEPFVRFYAGVPIHSADGYALGTLCLVDTKPRQLTSGQLSALNDLAMLVQEEFNKAALVQGAIQGTVALRRADAEFRATFEQAAVGIAHVDIEGRLINVNARFCHIVGRAADELKALTFQDITYPADLEADLIFFGELLEGKRASYSVEKRYIHSAGHTVWVNLTVALLRNEAGAPDYFISVIEDIQEKKEAQFVIQNLNAELEARVDARTTELLSAVTDLAAEVDRRSAAQAELRSREEHTRTILAASLDAFIEIDEGGTILKWNRAAEETFGWSASEALSKTLVSTIIPEEHRRGHEVGLNRFIETGEGNVVNRRLELPALTKSGRIIQVEMTISAYEIKGKHYFGAFLHDISERQAAAARLQEKQQLLDAILDSVNVGVIACDGSGSINLINQTAAKFYALSSDTPFKSGWSEVHGLYKADGSEPVTGIDAPLQPALLDRSFQNVEFTLRADDGVRHIVTSGRRLSTPNGTSLGAVIAMTDISALRHAEAERALNEHRLRAIAENLPALIGHIDRDFKVAFLNKHALDFFGKEAHEVIGRDLREIYPIDQYQMVSGFVEQARSGKKVGFEGHMRVGGKLKYFSASYVPESADEAGPVGFYAMAMDITARKTSELRQAESEERLRTITNNLPILIGYFDKDEIYRFANATYEQWFGVPPEHLIGKTVLEIVGPSLYEAGKAHMRQNLAGVSTRFETTYVTASGDTRTAVVAGMPHIVDSTVVGVYVMTTDISETKRHEKQLQLLARSDSLTGLPNRRAYEEKLQEAALRSMRSRQEIGLIFLDIDHFKSINDSLGHAGGDEVLKEFAHRLRMAIRTTDCACRLAGDEFTIILEGLVQADDAIMIAEKILACIRPPFFANGTPITVTTSIGIATQSPDALDLGMLSRRADEALYRAKEAGRNRYSR